MSNQPSLWKCRLAGFLALAFCATLQLHARQGFGGFGGFGGAGGGGGNAARGRTSAGTSTRQYPNNSTVGDAIISMDPQTHSLIVIADDVTAQHISEVISNLDRPKPQVLIKVVFLEVAHNDSLDIGVEGGYGKGFGNSTTGAFANAFGLSGLNLPFGSNNVNQFGQPVSSFAPIPPGAGLYQIFSTDYQVTLRMIAQAGKAKVLSRPSIVTRNNQPASILVGQSVPLITSVTYNAISGNPINSYQYTDVGIILRVTPFITADGMIEMIVSPEISSVSQAQADRVQIQAGTFAPYINKRSADTVIVTPDRQTVIIGGLITSTKTESVDKIPFLGDIPLLGNLFRHRTTAELKTELMIFLTPQIIAAPSQYAAVSMAEENKTSIPKALTEKELNEFLENLPSNSNGKKKSSNTVIPQAPPVYAPVPTTPPATPPPGPQP